MVVLYELAASNGTNNGGAHYSSYSWRTRMALRHKGNAFESQPVRISDKAAIAFSGQGRVPIIRHGYVVMSDSWNIAANIETTIADAPSLFGGAAGQAVCHFVNAAADRQRMGAAAPAVALSITQMLDPGDAAHSHAGFEKGFGKTLEELETGRGGAPKAFRRAPFSFKKVSRS